MRLAPSIALWAASLAASAAQRSTGSSASAAACSEGDPVTLSAATTGGAVVTSSSCAATPLSVVVDPKTNRTLAAGGYGIQQVKSVPDIDTLDLTQNAVATIADLSGVASIKKLVLVNNGLTSTKGIKWPASLTDLYLSSNALPAFTELGKLSLRTLTLNNVSISDITKISLPKTLTELNVAFNQLTKFPANDALSSLTKLTLTTNSISSFKDVTIPPSVQDLDLSWNSLASFDGLSLPSSVTKLYLGGNRFTSLAGLKTENKLTVLYVHDLVLGNLDGVKVPDTVSAFSLMNCSLTTLSNLALPSKLAYLDISMNQLTEIPTSYPDPVRSVTANNNQLTKLTNVKFSTSITKLDFGGNEIATVKGVVFPLVLETLNFGAFPIGEFEIRRSDVSIFQNLKVFNASVTQTSCSNAAAQSVVVQKVTLCVIPDDIFSKQYGSSSTSAVSSKSSSKGSSGWVLPVLICLAAVIVVGAIAFAVRRRRTSQKPMGQPDFSQNLAPNSSMFGDLPEFNPRAKPVPNTNTHNQTTINSFGSSHSNTLQFTGNFSSGSQTGPESSLLKYRIQTNEVTLQRALAHGGFGVVYLATYQQQDVVVKKILPEKAMDDRCLQAFLDEIKLNSTLSHPKIVRFIGVSWNTLSDIAVVMEYMPNGDLDSLLKKQQNRPAEEFDWFQSTNLPAKSVIALDILEAVVYLHSFSSPIIHRDLKAKNVLLSHNYSAKLSDFGVSKEWKVDATMTAGIGTMAWIAPEVLRGERYTEKADIYSFGVILTELATCSKPFEGVSNALIVLKVTSGEHRPDMGDSCPEDIRELGQRCLSYDASERPSAMVAHYELKTLLKAHVAFEL